MPLITSQRAAQSLISPDTPRGRTILFLEQQSWRSGAQKVLESVLEAIMPEFEPIVAFPNNGPFCQNLQERNIETVLFPLGSYRSGQKSFAEMMEFSARSLVCGLKLAFLIRRRKVGAVYVNGPRCLPAGVLASYLTGCPALFHLHLTLVRKEEVSLVTRLARYVAKIVACSHASAQSLLDVNPEIANKLSILYSPVPIDSPAADPASKPSGSTAAFTLGMVGRITEPKGQGKLLEAVGMLRPELQKKLRLIFVGAPAPGDTNDLAYARRIQKNAAQLPLGDRIHWVGYQPDPASFYASMDVLVQPSSAQSGEGLPMAILEALREGVPVITSRTGGIAEIIRHGANGLVVPPGDSVALAQALQCFLEDRSLRARLQAGATLDDRFSVESFQSKTLGLIRALGNFKALSGAGRQGSELTAWK